MKSNNYFQRLHPYREALQALLYDNPIGLSATEIANRLVISDAECQDLLKNEQMRESVDVDLSDGNLIYKFKGKSNPNLTIEEGLNIAKRRKFVVKLREGVAVFLSIGIGITISIKITQLNIFFMPENAKNSKVNVLENKNEERGNFNELRIEAKITATKIKDLINEKEDLISRISKMQSLSSALDCSRYWRGDNTCYIEGRLLTEASFDREIAQMKLRIAQINEILDSYKK